MPAVPQLLPAWSITVRLLHWLVAGGVLINLFNDTGYAHRVIGYVVLAFVAGRLVFGFWTRNPAERFRWPGFSDIRLHLSHLFHRRPESTPGHNPLGQLAVYAMWLLIGLSALTGWISRTDAYWGEDWPVDLHAWLADALLAMVLLHVAAVAVMSWWFRRNLIKPMIVRAKN